MQRKKFRRRLFGESRFDRYNITITVTWVLFQESTLDKNTVVISVTWVLFQESRLDKHTCHFCDLGTVLGKRVRQTDRRNVVISLPWGQRVISFTINAIMVPHHNTANQQQVGQGNVTAITRPQRSAAVPAKTGELGHSLAHSACPQNPKKTRLQTR